MEGERRKSSSTSSLQRTNSSRKIAEQFTGAGKSFTVSSLGSEIVSHARGDAVAADCMMKLKAQCAEAKVKKLAKITITLQFKGVTFLDEKSKSVILKVPVEKVTYVCHDPADTTVFAVIVRTGDPEGSRQSGLKLHAFQADLKTAISFVHSARELFQLKYKLVKAKKKRLSEQLETPEGESNLSPLYKGRRKSTPASTSQSKDSSTTTAEFSSPSTDSTDTRVSPSTVAKATVDSWHIEDHIAGKTSRYPLKRPEEEPIYFVPSSRPATKTTSAQEQKEAVLEEWNKLEAELNKIAKDLGMEDKPASNLHPPFQPYQQSSPGYKQQQSNPFDLNSSTSSDPFSDEFFQKSFDTPSVQSVSRSSDFTTFNPNTGGPGHFSSTPEGQPQIQPTTAGLASPPDKTSATTNPFEAGNGAFDPFQSGYGSTIGQPDFSAAFSETSNTLPLLQNPSMSSSSSPFGQPSLQNSSFFSPIQQPLRFGGASTDTRRYSGRLSASNPFATDFESPPFGGAPDPPHDATGSFTQPLINQSTGSASFRSDGSDPFADLLPLALGPAQSSLTEPSKSKQPVPSVQAPPATRDRGAIKTWDTFQSPRKEVPQRQEKPIEVEQPPPPKPPMGNIFHAFENSFHDLENHKAAASSGFEDSFQEAPADESSTSGFEDSFHSPRSSEQVNTKATSGGFKGSFHESHNNSTPSNFGNRMNGTRDQRKTDARALGSSHGPGPTHLAGNEGFDTGFDDHFVPSSDSSPQHSSRLTGEGKSHDANPPSSWIGFS